MPEKWDLERERAFKKKKRPDPDTLGSLDRANFAVSLIQKEFVDAVNERIGYDMAQNLFRAIKEIEQAKRESFSQTQTSQIHGMETQMMNIVMEQFENLCNLAGKGERGIPTRSGNPDGRRDEYHLNTQTGELCDAHSQSLTGFRRRVQKQGFDWTKVIVPISKKVYDMLNPSGQITTKYHDD